MQFLFRVPTFWLQHSVERFKGRRLNSRLRWHKDFCKKLVILNFENIAAPLDHNDCVMQVNRCFVELGKLSKIHILVICYKIKCPSFSIPLPSPPLPIPNLFPSLLFPFPLSPFLFPSLSLKSLGSDVRSQRGRGGLRKTIFSPESTSGENTIFSNPTL